MPTHLVISKGTELLRVPLVSLMYVSAEGNYSIIVTRDSQRTLMSLQLGQIETLISQQLGSCASVFIRAGRGLIINTDYINYIDVSKQILVLSDCQGSRHELSASREVLIKLKEYVESTIK
jgi:DNA-binding LytR/AlgR family response regulator